MNKGEVWRMKLPGKHTLSVRGIKSLTDKTVTLIYDGGYCDTYTLSDVEFIEQMKHLRVKL